MRYRALASGLVVPVEQKVMARAPGILVPRKRTSPIHRPTDRRGLVVTTASRFTSGSFVAAGGGDGAPDYTGAPGQDLLFAGDSTEPVYADLTAAGAAPFGASMRLVPATSPALGGPAVPTEHFALPVGKGGSGKAIQNIFPESVGQPGDKWWLASSSTLSGASGIDIGKTIHLRVMVKFDGATPTEPKVTKFHQHPVEGFEAGSSPQWTIVDTRAPYAGSYNPFTTQPNGGSLSVWRIDDAFTDTASAFPDGNDQALQAQGPFPRDDWGEWRKMVFSFRPRQTGVLSSAIRDLWITPFGSDTARLAMSVRESSIGVVPEFSVTDGGGSGKQYCGVDMVTEGSTDGASLSGLMTFGGLSFAAVSAGQDWTIDWNIGDGDPLNPDTMVAWTED